jgi:predicted nuclease of restriction endonuclease-like (RecB) superfamily
MRAFAAAWPSGAIVQRTVGQLPWGHVVTLLNRLDAEVDRDWYAERAVLNGWSRKNLEHHIATDLRGRIGNAPSNFPALLDDTDSDLAQELVRDSYVFDFLGLTERASERDVEQAMMDKLQDTLMELGNGFAFVGRQVHFDVDGDEFFVDLLFFHVEQLRYVVVELKIGRFKHEYAGQLSFYVTLVDNLLRRPAQHAPSVGILLCTSRNDTVVRYALQSTTAPMAVSTYSYDALPPAEKATLPAADEITAAFRPTPQVNDPDRLLSELGKINPNLDHRRSIDRVRNTWLDISQGKDDATLLRNVIKRFSNGNTVNLDGASGALVLDIIRATLELQER